MKKLLLAALLGAPFLMAPAHAQRTKKTSAKKVNWQPSFAAALAEAKRTGKPIFVDFYTTWCGPCKYLDAVTYKDAKFVAESQKWVMVKVDAEKGAANVKLAQKFKVDGYPSMIFLTPKGVESDRAVGGYPANLLVPKMKKAADKASGAKAI